MTSTVKFGSDLIADVLKALGIEYLAFNPGTTFRGLHESLVNYSRAGPKLVLCLHEEVAVAVAQGYGVASNKPMAIAVHAIVGLTHASMGVYNAWCDKVPVILLGGAASLDAAKRRNRPEWLHSAIVPGNLVRNFVKWDDYVISASSVVDSLLRAYRIAMEHPRGPVYVCLDSDMQEDPVKEPVDIPLIGDILKPAPLSPDPDVLKQVAALMVKAETPVVLADQMGRNPETTAALVELAELLAIPVVDLSRRFNFPNNHPLDLKGELENLLSRADLVLALEVEDLWSQLHKMDRSSRKITSKLSPGCKVIDISLRDLATRGWVQDYQRFQASDIALVADTAAAVPQLVSRCRDLTGKKPKASIDERRQWAEKKHREGMERWQEEAASLSREKPIAVAWLAHEIWPAIKDEDWVMATGHGSLAEWARRLWVMDRPYQFIPAGGIGLGRGMGVAIGAALANRKNDRLVINLQADGDLLYTPQAIWTAVNNRIPMVVVVYNNRCYGNSEYFFGFTARSRGRPEETRGEGTYMDAPPVDFAAMARCFGAYGEGPITDPQDIMPAIKRAVNEARKNSLPAVVDVVCRRTDTRPGVG